MSLDPTTASDLAETLYTAYETKEPIEPLTEETELTTADAYDVQSRVLETVRGADGERVGHKLGLVSEAKQEQLGIAEPIFGALTDEMLLEGPVPTDELIAPRLEAEVGFLIEDSLEPPVSTTDVLAATGAVVPVVEILESRFAGWSIPSAQDVIADMTSAAYVVVGERFRDVRDVDLATESVLVRHNGELAATGVAADIMGHPARSVAWLGDRLADRDDSIEAGELVISGGISAAIDVEPADVFSVDFATIGSISVRAE
jgi:2-keto-4-pentenoate hydratase